jgi:hypothetical protein
MCFFGRCVGPYGVPGSRNPTSPASVLTFCEAHPYEEEHYYDETFGCSSDVAYLCRAGIR